MDDKLGSDITNLRILIVDDEKMITDLLKGFFERNNNECETASDGEVGFLKVLESHFDFILMDIKMPNMNGCDCIRAIRQVDPHVPILIMTGYATPQEIELGLENGANGVLKKPFEFEALLTEMCKILGDGNTSNK